MRRRMLKHIFAMTELEDRQQKRKKGSQQRSIIQTLPMIASITFIYVQIIYAISIIGSLQLCRVDGTMSAFIVPGSWQGNAQNARREIRWGVGLTSELDTEKDTCDTDRLNGNVQKPLAGVSSSYLNGESSGKNINGLSEANSHCKVVTDLVDDDRKLQHNSEASSTIENGALAPRKKEKYKTLSRLSKMHRTMMAKTSNMRRQRFVTGKYPLYVTVEQNPTKKWLGLTRSQIYLNGTNIEKSLASYDTFHWLDDEERRILHGDYEFLSLELVAEINVRKPGYVNILPRNGAGASLLKHKDDGVFGWKSWKIRDALSSRLESFDLEDSDRDRLWITGFSLTKQRGELHTLDVCDAIMANVRDKTARAIKWPNEVGSVPRHFYSFGQKNPRSEIGPHLADSLLVTDGFLVPGKDRGGLYVVKKPGNLEKESKVRLTDVRSDWFYHRAIWVDLTGDGRKSILAARAKLPSFLKGNKSQDEGKSSGSGQLVWLECPTPYAFDPLTGTPLGADGTIFDPLSKRNTPWKLRVLAEGPDVMFSVADLDSSDNTIEVIASEFFSRKLSLHSIAIGPKPKVVFKRVIDDGCGSGFSSVLADLDGLMAAKQYGYVPRVVDSGSTVELLKRGDAFSHVLVTSHECSLSENNIQTDLRIGVTSGQLHHSAVNKHCDRETSEYEHDGYDVSGRSNGHNNEGSIASGKVDQAASRTNGSLRNYSSPYAQSKIDGGSLFAYRVPAGKDAWKTEKWTRSVIATGFKVQGQLSNMIYPGAPGFCYTFFPTRERGTEQKWSRPLIGLSGDCAEAAYILRPSSNTYVDNDDSIDASTDYALMCEIKCKATVGSLAIGYDDIESAQQHNGYAKIYVPCYEQDKVLVFAMGDGEGEELDDEW